MGKDLNGRELGKGISQRKDKRYMGRAMVNGETIVKYSWNVSQLKRELKEGVEKLRYQQVAQTAANMKQEIILVDWFERWFKNYKLPLLKETGVAFYRRKFMNTFGKHLGECYLTEITQFVIQSVATELINQGLSPRTVREVAGVLRQCLETAVINGLISSNPAVGIVVPRDRKGDRRVLTIEEQQLFLSHVNNKNDWYKELYSIMFLTGIRIGEVGGLRVSDIDYEKKFIHVNRSLSWQYESGKKLVRFTSTKTQNSVRIIPFFRETEKVLRRQEQKIAKRRKELGERWRNDTEFDDLVFYTSMGSPVGRYSLQHSINKLVDEINLIAVREAREAGTAPKLVERFHPHAIRHTFATRCFEKHMDPVVVQRIMGHANYNTTLSYTHVLENIQREEAEKIGSFLGQESSTQIANDVINHY